MPTSAAGNKPSTPMGAAETSVHLARPHARLRPLGFTLVELLVVITLIAIATAGASLALRDSAANALERDAQRLAAMLESARAQSRASGAPVLWRAQSSGFVLQGLPRPSPVQAWLSERTRAEPGPPVLLGPEPLIAPQRITLYNAEQPMQRLSVVTDGLRPFAVTREPSGAVR